MFRLAVYDTASSKLYLTFDGAIWSIQLNHGKLQFNNYNVNADLMRSAGSIDPKDVAAFVDFSMTHYPSSCVDVRTHTARVANSGGCVTFHLYSKEILEQSAKFAASVAPPVASTLAPHVAPPVAPPVAPEVVDASIAGAFTFVEPVPGEEE